MSIVITPIPSTIELAAPAFTLGSANTAGAAVTAVSSNSTLLTFDATSPVAVAAAAVVGSAAIAARRDHVHPGIVAVTSTDNAITRYNGTAGEVQNYTSNPPTASDAGIVLTPGQPAFLAYNGAVINNVTGNNGQYIGVFGTPLIDQAGNYDDTSTFTAPVDGRYRFSTNITLNGVTTSGTRGRLRIITTDKTYEVSFNPSNNEATTDVASSISLSTLADMDANDTATVGIMVGGEGSDVVDFAGTGELVTAFSGELVA